MPDEREPGCPGDLDATGKDLWRKVRTHIQTRGDWQAVYAHLVSLLARADMRARKAREDVQKSGSLTVAGSKDQIVPHPSIKTAREAERDVLEYMRALRLTPQEIAKGQQEPAKPPTGGKFGDRLG